MGSHPNGKARVTQPAKVIAPSASPTPTPPQAPDRPRLKSFLGALLVALDTLAVIGAFGLGYFARRRLPLFNAPIDPPTFGFYLPILVIQTLTFLTLFFVARLYHQRRAVSRIDQAFVIAAKWSCISGCSRS